MVTCKTLFLKTFPKSLLLHLITDNRLVATLKGKGGNSTQNSRTHFFPLSIHPDPYATLRVKFKMKHTLETLDKLCTKKCWCLDGIYAIILRNCGSEIFSDLRTTALIQLIPKNGSKLFHSSCNLVSILAVTGKLNNSSIL